MRLGLNKLNDDVLTSAKFVLSKTDGKFSKKHESKNNLIVSGFVTSELNLSGGNEFTSPFEDSEKIKKGMKFFNVFKTALSVSGGNAGGTSATLTKNQTILFYTGSQKPTFSIEAAFITLDSAKTNETALYKVKELMKLVYPTGSEIMEAPLGYIPLTKDGTPSGTVSLRVGNWFHARYLVVKDVNFTMSKEVTANGTPLYAVGNITLEPYRSLSYDEYSAYFSR